METRTFTCQYQSSHGLPRWFRIPGSWGSAPLRPPSTTVAVGSNLTNFRSWMRTTCKAWGKQRKRTHTQNNAFGKVRCIEMWGFCGAHVFTSSSKTGCLCSLLAYWQLYYRSYRPLALMQKVQGDMVQTSDLSGSHLANLSTWALLEPQWLALCTAKVTPLEWFEV